MKRYKVTLTTEERCELRDLIAAGKAAAKKLAHARILLKADASPGGPAWTDQRIAEAVEVGGQATVERVAAAASWRRAWRQPWSARAGPTQPRAHSSMAGPRLA